MQSLVTVFTSNYPHAGDIMSTPYLVVHIGDVHHKVDIELEVVAHNSANDIGANIVAGVSQMRVVVDSRSASIPHHLLSCRVDRDERCLGLGQGVPHLQCRQLRIRTGGWLPPGRLLARRHGPKGSDRQEKSFGRRSSKGEEPGREHKERNKAQWRGRGSGIESSINSGLAVDWWQSCG